MSAEPQWNHQIKLSVLKSDAPNPIIFRIFDETQEIGNYSFELQNLRLMRTDRVTQDITF